MLKVLSVNVGKPQAILSKNGITGIFKKPQVESVVVNRLGLNGDTIVDTQNHGGVDQAVYVYCQGDYDWWCEQESMAVAPGLFGENITLEGMTTSDAHVGARLVGENVILEITSPRTPCETLATRMNDKTFLKRFWKSHRTGFYCRVIEEGNISAGETMQLQPFDGEKITVSEWISSEPLVTLDDTGRARFLSVPLHYKTRKELSK